MLKSAGYHDGLAGKWHLGLGNPPKTDFNGDIKPGPLEIGFDYAFYIPAPLTANQPAIIAIVRRRQSWIAVEWTTASLRWDSPARVNGQAQGKPIASRR